MISLGEKTTNYFSHCFCCKSLPAIATSSAAEALTTQFGTIIGRSPQRHKTERGIFHTLSQGRGYRGIFFGTLSETA